MTTELFEPIFWAANAITVEPQENNVMKMLIDTTRTHTEPNLHYQQFWDVKGF